MHQKYEDTKVYRFRPRKNLHVNGHFICDSGRLSYKALNENRLTTALSKKRVAKIESTLKKVSKQFKEEAKKTLILVSPSLSLEELVALKHFADTYKIKLFGSESKSFDESFADDMLKSADLAANRKALNLLGINESKEECETALSKATLVFNFANLDFQDWEDSKKQSWVQFTTHKLATDSLQIPIKSYSEKSGMVINSQAILQAYHSKIEHSYMLLDIEKIIEAIVSKGYESCNILESLQKLLPLPEGSDLNSIPKNGIELEIKS